MLTYIPTLPIVCNYYLFWAYNSYNKSVTGLNLVVPTFNIFRRICLIICLSLKIHHVTTEWILIKLNVTLPRISTWVLLYDKMCKAKAFHTYYTLVGRDIAGACPVSYKVCQVGTRQTWKLLFVVNLILIILKIKICDENNFWYKNTSMYKKNRAGVPSGSKRNKFCEYFYKSCTQSYSVISKSKWSIRGSHTVCYWDI